MHNRFPLRVHSLPVSQPWEDQILFVSTSNNEIETRAGRRFLPWKCIRRPTWGEKTGGEGKGWKLDYLKFRGNYEGNYRGNLFLDPIVHRGERSTIRSSRKTSATGEIGVLASPRSILRSSLKSSRWPRAKFISNDLVKMATGSLLVIATLSDPFCGYRPFLSERNFLLLTRMYSERGCFICSISSFIERIYNWYYFFSSSFFYSLFEMIKFSNWNNNNNSNNRKGERKDKFAKRRRGK